MALEIISFMLLVVYKLSAQLSIHYLWLSV